MSRGFVAALCGLGVTIFSWYSPWEWPAWPAFTVLHLIFGTGQSWLELPQEQRAMIIIVLIAINATFWALIAYAALRVIERRAMNPRT